MGCKVVNVQAGTVHSHKAPDGLVGIILLLLPWRHIIPALCHPAPWIKASKPPGAGMLKGRSIYLLKLVPRILIQTYSSSTSYILARISTYKKKKKGKKDGGVGYNFPLLQIDWEIICSSC